MPIPTSTGQQRHVVRRPELAAGRVVGTLNRVEGRATRHHASAVCQRRLVRVGMELRDEHRRRRRQVVRIDDLEQRLCEAREFGVELQLHARGEKRRPFDQPLDVGIVDDVDAVHAEARGDLRRLRRELGAHLAQVLELEVVELKEAGVHQRHPRLGEFGDLDLSSFEVDLGPHEQIDRDRLRPQLTGDLDRR